MSGHLRSGDGVSRGALYHQFGDKTELFAEVLDVVEADVTHRLVAAMPAGEAVLVVLERALEAWLDACESPDVQRIVLIDGPSVLGWVRWRAICQQHILGLLESVIKSATVDGELLPLPTKPLAHILLAIADEAAMYLHAADDQTAARAEITQVVGTLPRALVAPARLGETPDHSVSPSS